MCHVIKMSKRAEPPLDQDQTPPPVQQRRSQAERTEETRRRALDAAIRCIARNGYHATTTTRVATEAQISRGGMLHHFPTKTDLIVAAAEDITHRLHEQRKAELIKVDDDVERFRALTTATWQSSQGPEELALIEIMLAARGDEGLADKLPDVARRLDDFQYEGTLRMADDAGLGPQPLVRAMHRLHQAAIRGLVIELLFARDKAEIDAAFDLLCWYKDLVITRMQQEVASDR
jgi:AcrR family transcriptional regulator